MDHESFADGGYSWHTPTMVNVDSPDLVKYRDFSVYKCAHAVKWCCRFVMVLIVMFIIIKLIEVPVSVAAMVKYIKTKQLPKKEGLQWLGASSDVIRGDYENNQDSLAEKAAKMDVMVTDMSPVVAKFSSRERMTPEEEEMRKMAK